MKILLQIDPETVKQLSEGLSHDDYERIVANTDLGQLIPPWAMGMPTGVVKRELDEALKYNWTQTENESGVHITYCKYGPYSDALKRTRKKVKRLVAKKFRRIFKQRAKRG